jgi:hypothetical protein
MVKKNRKSLIKDSDEEFFLKLVMFLVFGSLWLRIERFPEWQLPIPFGLLLGLWFASRDHFAINRKIEYAVLLLACLFGFWLPIGVRVSL